MKPACPPVPGHGLLFEGRCAVPAPVQVPMPYYPEHTTNSGRWMLDNRPTGIGVCRCGATSEILPSTAARQRWHRNHKDQVRDN